MMEKFKTAFQTAAIGLVLITFGIVEVRSMEKQKELLEAELKAWMGDVSQIDDILVIGVRI